MAFDHVYDLTFIIEDALNPSQIAAPTLRVGVDGAELSWADLTALAAQVKPIIQNLINGHVRRAYASKMLTEWAGAAAAAADVEEGALFILEASGTDKPVRLTIPTIDENFILNTTGKVDLTAAPVIAFTSLLTNGITINAKLVRCIDSETRPLTGIRSATEVFTRSRKKRR